MPYGGNSLAYCENSEIAGDLEKRAQDITSGGLTMTAVSIVDLLASVDVRQPMICESVDSTTATRMDNAVALLLRLEAKLPEIPESELAGRAIDATYCTNLVVGSNAVVCQLGTARAPLMMEATRLARPRLSRTMQRKAGEAAPGGQAVA